MRVAVILPSLDPDEKLMRVVSGLITAGFSNIIIINDGSSPEHLAPFEEAARHPQCTVLRHERNEGKGRALKTGFAHFLRTDGESVGVVTVDGDDQHAIEDVVHCAQELERDPHQVVLGVRDFSQPDVPWRSRVGNRLTSLVFRSACGLDICDTQTGLRAIGREYLESFLELPGERFEYETNMLLELRTQQIPFSQLKIRTVYIEENRTSHFDPLRDSLRIYRLLGKFLLASGCSFLVDILGFWLLSWLLRDLPLSVQVLWATAIARVVSSGVNYALNRGVVFTGKGQCSHPVLKYYTLCVIQMLVSYAGVYLLTLLFKGGSVPIKVVVDCVLFFISFQIQRDWVFKKRREAARPTEK